MSRLSDQMVKEISILPEQEQDMIASLILDLLGGSSEEEEAEEAEWDALVGSEKSQAWIDEQARGIFSGSEQIYDFDPANLPE